MLQPLAAAIVDTIAGLEPSTLVVVDVNCRPVAIDDDASYRARVAAVAARADVVKASDEDLDYLALGATHAPFHVAAEWRDKYAGRFDAGWDIYRQETFARQKRLGLIPADARLPPPPPGIKPWASLSAEQRKVYATYMEAYAAALANSGGTMRSAGAPIASSQE